MSFFVKPTIAPQARSKQARQISIVVAAIFVIFAVAQLFTFEEFIELTASFNLPFGYAFAPLIIVAEVFALPFLLRMTVSPAFRALSMGFGWIAALLWLLTSIVVVSTQHEVSNIGFLGTVVEIIPGWWSVLVSIALAILVTWSSWGLWPGKRKS